MLRLKTPLSRQFLVFIAVVTLTTIPPLLVSSIPALALAFFLAGGAISPTFITAFGLIERLVPSSQLTEGITWGMTGIGIGMAIGSIASGYVIDAFGAQSGFWVSVAAGVVAIATALIGNRTLEVPAAGRNEAAQMERI
jgi:predicted MFS family arabinose efflux permease